MQIIDNSVNLGTIEHATIYSDWHLSPAGMLNMAGTVLHSRNWSPQTYPNLPIGDIFNPPIRSGNIVIGAGDMFHLGPLFPFQKELVPDALSYFAEALYKKGVTGESFKLILGNHTRVENFPPDVLSFLSEEHILAEDGRISFDSGGENFFVMHGHEAQPGFYHLPFSGNPKIARIMDKALDKFKKINRNGDVNGQYPLPAWFKNILNRPQKNWQNRNLPAGTKMISGHTHVPEATPDYLNSGFLDVLFGYLSYGIVENGKMQSIIKEI